MKIHLIKICGTVTKHAQREMYSSKRLYQNRQKLLKHNNLKQIIINPKAKRRRKYRQYKSLPEKTTEKQQKSMKPKPGSKTRTIKFINLKTDGSRIKKKRPKLTMLQKKERHHYRTYRT